VFTVNVNASDGLLSNAVSFTLEVVDTALLCTSPTNVALEGVASQSSDHGSLQFPASKAINGVTTDFSHTSADGVVVEWWELSLPNLKQIDQIMIHNRDDCCGDRLRDLIVSVKNSQGVEIYQSELLNAENNLGSPNSLIVDLPPFTQGEKIRITRVPDPDLSGGSGAPLTGYVLALGEVIVQACAAQGGQ